MAILETSATIKWDKSRPYSKIVRLRDCDGRVLHERDLARSACVTNSDTVIVDEDSTWYVKCQHGWSKIYPAFGMLDTLKIGDIQLEIQVKEIETKADFEGYSTLTSFHYRDKGLFGRHAPLVATTTHPLLPHVIGYIELTPSFFFNKPRRNLFDQPTQLNGVVWEDWTANTARQYVPLFVRIARCVVHPELRSAGLGTLLVKHAASFAKTHWQSANYRPYFMEITADMLRYIPFAEKAGMTYVGNTEGNLHRIAQDIDYIERTQQVEGIFEERPVGPVAPILAHFREATKAGHNLQSAINEHFENPSLDGWATLANILSFPKPHYMMGLTPEAEALLAKRVKMLNLPELPAKDATEQFVVFQKLETEIQFDRVAYTLPLTVPRTPVTHQVERAFGISVDAIEQQVFKQLTLSIAAGEIVALTGLSGTGKTTLLRLLREEISPTAGKITLPVQTRVGYLQPIVSSEPLIEVISGGDVAKGLFWLSMVGLSEPFLYLKPFAALSAGQKVRAMIAKLLVEGANVWLLDEFCENLDIINTQLLAAKLSKVARQIGAVVIAGSADVTRFVRPLDADRIIVLKGISDAYEYEVIMRSDIESWLEGL